MPLSDKQQLNTAMLMVKQANPALAKFSMGAFNWLLKKPLSWAGRKLWGGVKGIPRAAKGVSLFAAPAVPYMVADSVPGMRYLPGVGSGFDDAVFNMSGGRLAKDHRQLMEGFSRFVDGPSGKINPTDSIV